MRTPTLTLAATLLVLALQATAPAQRGNSDFERTRTGPERELAPVARERIARPDVLGLSGSRPAILLTGYWPPSNEMLRRFSPDPVANPQGWLGSDWEGRGYDVYAYFPEFSPPNCSSCGKGTGTLQVDYQNTSADFWALVASLEPIAVITFSRGFLDTSWELEMNQYNRSLWIADFEAPLFPTPTPPDASVPAGFLRKSMLPMQEVVDAVAAQVPALSPYICYTGDGGGYLSEFIAYHGVWYQALHADPSDPAWCVAAGHVHVGGFIDWATARVAAEVTLRTVIAHVDRVVGCAGSVASACPSTPSSAGTPATLAPYGLPSLGQNLFGLTASGLPPAQMGLFFYGAPKLPSPFGDGFLCAANPIFRLGPPQASDANGELGRKLDLSAPPLDSGAGAAQVGATHAFQLWYRDPAAAGAGFNLSDSLEVTWCP